MAGPPLGAGRGDRLSSSLTSVASVRKKMADQGLVSPITQSRTLKFVAVYALLVGVYAVLPALKEHFTRTAGYADIPAEMHAALTLVLGWLLVFRTNAAYNRWWEARTLWGGLVNCCRNLTVKVFTIGSASLEDRQDVARLVDCFPPLLRDHLRKEIPNPRRPRAVVLDESLAHAPSELVQRIYDIFVRWKGAGEIDGEELKVLDHEASRLLDICGGCERIRNTRIVRSYRIFARQCVGLFLLTFPWGIVNDFSWWTIPLTIITAYFMIGLETVAEHVEEPFGYDEDDLDLDGLCETISRSIQQIVTRNDPAGASAESHPSRSRICPG